MKLRIDRSGAGLQAPLLKWLVPIFLCILIFSPGLGRGNEISQELSKSEFAVILGKYQKFSRMDVHFSQTKNITDLGLKLPSKGRLTVIRPDTVIWQIDKPSFLKVTINAREISMQSENERDEINQLLDQVPEKMAANLKEMILWLRFDAQALYQRFHITSQGLRRYAFKPRKNNGDGPSFTSMTMVLGPRGNVKNMRMVEESGDFIDILFDEPQFQNSP